MSTTTAMKGKLIWGSGPRRNPLYCGGLLVGYVAAVKGGWDAYHYDREGREHFIGMRPTRIDAKISVEKAVNRCK